MDKLKALWGGKFVHIAGVLVALAAAVLADVNLPDTPHAAIWIPFLLGLVTEAGAVFGKVDLAKLNPRILNLALGGLTALSAYLTSNPSVSSWRYGPIALAIVFSIRKALGGAVAAPPAPPPAVALLLAGALALPSLSCAHVGPVVSDFVDCAAPEMQAVCAELKPRVIDALICSGGNAAALPPCALAQLADLEQKHGRAVVACAAQAIRDALFLPSVGGDPSVIKARAAEYLKGQEARGLKLRPAP